MFTPTVTRSYAARYDRGLFCLVFRIDFLRYRKPLTQVWGFLFIVYRGVYQLADYSFWKREDAGSGPATATEHKIWVQIPLHYNV